ncbi:MAG TPA: hypothetical protein VNO55_02545 [Polyangia bacterium]|nr:hypothetical protein [Polyangia bacterium]
MSKLTIRYLVLAALPLFVFGCGHDTPSSGGTGGAGSGGSSGSGGTTGSGGSSDGSGGTSGGSGGTSGDSGGASAGSGGATGSGGTVVMGSGGSDGGTVVDGGISTCPAATATSPLISDFASGTTPASNQANGGTDVWTVSPQGTATVVTGEMHAQSTGGNWGSTGTVLGKAKCVDVSKYTGIKFKIRSATNTALLFVVSTPETTGDSSNFRMQIAVTPTSTVVTVPFASLVKAPFGAGMALGADYKPAAHLYGIGFGVGVMTELLDIFVDDVTFY